jgi:hypothetical protein
VSVLAWLFIVGSGGVVFVSVLQAAMFFLVIPAESLQAPARISEEFRRMPGAVRYMFEHPLLFFVLFWTLAVTTLIAAIGLLQRRNWARVTFIGLMAVSIIWNLGSLWLQQSMVASFPVPANAPPQFADEFATMALVMKVGTAIFAIGISVLCAWIAKKLASSTIRAEFNAL